MKFKKQQLKELVWGDEPEGLMIVEEPKIIDTSRWSIIYEMIFSFEDKFYETSFCRGATEHQEESPYEYDEDEIECKEVVPVEKTIIVYEIRKD